MSICNWENADEDWDVTERIWNICEEIAAAIVGGVRGGQGRLKDEDIDDIVTLVCKVRGYNEYIERRMKHHVKVLVADMLEKEKTLNETIKVTAKAL